MTALTLLEVAPRDGLQNERTPVSTADKVLLIERAVAAGARRLEVTSFVNPARVPQMADAEQVMAAIRDRFAHLGLIGLALNAKGAERALAAGCLELNYVVVATDGFARANQNTTVEDLVRGAGRIGELCRAAGVPWSVSIAVAFGCPFEGEVAPERVVAIVEALKASGPDEIALADTIGVAVPSDVAGLFRRVAQAVPGMPLRAHFHDTRNTAVANAVAAVGAGVTTLDCAIGGVGGCPFAPGATGNVATEDLVYALSRMGHDTGIDLDQTIDTARWLSGVLGKPVPGALTRAGGFPKTS